METPTLAIDFGTSRTKVAFFDERTGKPQLVELGTEIRTVLPSVFYMPKEIQGKRLVGDDAQNMAEKDPAGIILSLKKEIHKLGKKRCGDRPSIGRVELASELFAYIYQQCQREVFYNEDSIRCRLTVPSDFKAPQRDAIKNAAQLGGFIEITTIDEPVAAAQSWLRNHSDKKFGSSVVVCDIGGGTTDFAFLRYAGGHFEADEQILSAGFSEGGNDLDVLIWEKMCENNPATGEMDDLVAGFLIKIRRERELIAKTHQEEILLSVKGQQCVLTRAIIKDATSEFIERVKAETRRFLDIVRKQAKSDTPPIVLVGGASRLPGLCEALTSLTAGAVYLWNDSDYATVLGAVEIPIKASGPIRAGLWEEYGKAVEVAWADRVVQQGELVYLVRLQEKLRLSESEAAQIETAIMGATKESLVSRVENHPIPPQSEQRKHERVRDETRDPHFAIPPPSFPSSRLTESDAAAWKAKALVSVQQERYPDAFIEFSKALAILPNDIESLSGKAQCFLAGGQFSDAARNFEAAWRLAGDNRDLKKSTVYSIIAEMLSKPHSGIRPDFLLSPNIPDTKLRGALQSYVSQSQVSPEESVLLLHDGTMLGSGEDGFCLTEEAIYWQKGWNYSLYPGARGPLFQKYDTIEDIKSEYNKVTLNGREIYGLLHDASNFQTLLSRLRDLCVAQPRSERNKTRIANPNRHYYYGHCRNDNFGVEAAMFLTITPAEQVVSGSLELFGLGGSGEINGMFIGSQIEFTTNDLGTGFKCVWRGNMVGKAIEGTYNATSLTSEPEAIQTGVWKVLRFE